MCVVFESLTTGQTMQTDVKKSDNLNNLRITCFSDNIDYIVGLVIVIDHLMLLLV